jgi:UTP:GlnB (protein PII) uridylyltransferase
VEPSKRCRELPDQRLAEAVAVLGAVPDVCGLVVGGSLGGEEPWPLSDIDLLPISTAAPDLPERLAELGRLMPAVAPRDRPPPSPAAGR